MASYNVLITALGGDIAQGVLKALRLFAPRSRVIGTDKWPASPGLFMCEKAYVIRPSAGENARGFIRRIIKICNAENIQIAFICHEAEQMAVAAHRSYLEKNTKTYFVVQPLATFSRCSDKIATYKFLADRGIRVPDTANHFREINYLVKKYKFPLVIKPRVSSGSRDFNIVASRSEAKRAWTAIAQPLIQEYIGNANGDEYTVGVFLDNDSRSLGAITMLRVLRFGLTWYGFVDNFPAVAAVAIAAAEAVKAVGPCNVQLRLDKNNQPCVIEINARFSSTVAFRAQLGFNEVGAAIDYFINHKAPQLAYRTGMVMKTWGEMVIPLARYRQLIKQKVIINKL